MAKAKTGVAKAGVYGLKFGHPTEYRRTVEITAKGGTKQRVQLLFQPNTPHILSDEEVTAVQDIIDGGLLVPWSDDPKGRRIHPAGLARPSDQKPKSARVETGEVVETEPDDTGKKDKGDVEHKPRKTTRLRRRK